MGISLTIFLGSKDPNLIFALNQCPNDCCLIDPDDVEKFIGALPAFTIDETERILAYTLNIFRQFTYPTYSFHLERGSYQRQKELENCQQKLEKLLDDQLNYLISRRYYRELFLHNSLVNLVAASGGNHLSDLKLAEKAPVVVIADDDPESFKEFSRIKDAVIIAPFFLIDAIKENGVNPTIAVTNDPVISDHVCNTQLLVIDLVANPKLALSESQLIWTSSNSDLDLSHLIEGSLEEKVDAYVTEEEFALYVAVELGARTIFIAGELEDAVEKKFKDNALAELKDIKDFPLQKRPSSNPLLVIDEHERNLIPKRIYNDVFSAIEKEKPESDLFRALVWASEFDATIKLMNGRINYQTINQVEADLEAKKKSFLNLIQDVKGTIIKNSEFAPGKYKKIINSLPHESIIPDFDFEVNVLLQANPHLAGSISQIKRKDYPANMIVELSAKLKLDLYIRKSSGIFQYFGHDADYIEAEYHNALAVNIIVIPGLMNAEMQLLCFELFPGIPVVTLEPSIEHIAQVIKKIPLISIMGRGGIWLQGGVNDLGEAYRNLVSSSDVNALILDPDPQNLRDDLAVLKRIIKSID